MNTITEIRIAKTMSQIVTSGKQCACCGTVHRVIHSKITIAIEEKYPRLSGIYFNCKCGGTMFKQLAKL